MNELVKIRVKKGHTLQDAAAEMGVSFMTVHCTETGKTLPRLKTLDKMTHYYDLSSMTIIKTVIEERQKRGSLARPS